MICNIYPPVNPGQFTEDLKWIHPETNMPGGHGGYGSGKFHLELKSIIDNSQSLDEFNHGVVQLRNKWQIDPKLLPTLPKITK